MKRKSGTFEKNKKNIIGILFFFSLCLILILLIIYTQGEMQGLQQMIAKLSASSKAKLEEIQKSGEPQEIPYTKTLRIVLTDEDGDIYRDSVRVESSHGMSVLAQGATRTFAAGEVYAVSAAEVAAAGGVVITLPAGRLFFQNEHGEKSRGYEGKLELCAQEQGMVLVNEIDLEAYLKGVVPSEMPSTYGMEALKAQAICARTYAYAHSNTYAYPQVNAQMDDTTSFQVYNKGSGAQETDQAVAETSGMVLTSGGNLIDALYYSTSCGYEQDGTLFDDAMDTAVLSCVYIGTEKPGSSFEDYIRAADPGAYEAQERYFRWQAVPDVTKTEQLRGELAALLNKEGAVTCSGEMKKKISAGNTEGGALGTLLQIAVNKRNPGGAAEQVTLTFGAGEVTVFGQLSIRDVLGSITNTVRLQDGEEVQTAGRLPSAAFAVAAGDGGSLTLYGGGFGHGVGMSQNGAKNLAAIGFTYRDILMFFYKNTEITEIE